MYVLQTHQLFVLVQSLRFLNFEFYYNSTVKFLLILNTNEF